MKAISIVLIMLWLLVPSVGATGLNECGRWDMASVERGVIFIKGGGSLLVNVKPDLGELLAMQGENTWINGTWAFPEDLIYTYVILGQSSQSQPVYIVFYIAPSTPDTYYVITGWIQGEGGDHACSGVALPRDTVDKWLTSAFSNG